MKNIAFHYNKWQIFPIRSFDFFIDDKYVGTADCRNSLVVPIDKDEIAVSIKWLFYSSTKVYKTDSEYTIINYYARDIWSNKISFWLCFLALLFALCRYFKVAVVLMIVNFAIVIIQTIYDVVKRDSFFVME